MKETPNAMDHLSDELLSERLDGLLDPAAQARAEAHLAQCAACAARYAGLQRVQHELRAMRQVDAVPDFRLTAQGLPRAFSRLPPVAATPVARPAFVRVAARLVSAAMLLAGVALIILAIGTTFPQAAPQYSAAESSAAGHTTTGATACGAQCPSAGTPARPVNSGTNSSATPTPTTTRSPAGATPTPMPTTTLTGPAPPSSSTGTPLTPPVEFGLGVALAAGGIITLTRLGRRT
jgi:hypothetical protein